MLLQQARFAEARQLTEMLVNDPHRWSVNALLTDNGVAHDADRAAPLLAAWAQIVTLATGASGELFADTADARPRWAQLGIELTDAATHDAAAVEEAADRCACELEPDDRALQIEHLAGHVSDVLQLAGGLEELLDQESLHRQYSGDADSGWVSTAAWTICALSELHQAEAHQQITRLITQGHGADVWRTWPHIAASMMSPQFLTHMYSEDFPDVSPTYPTGLARRAVEAVHETTKQLKRTQTEFAAQCPDDQIMLAFELAMMIASVWRLPARKEARRAEHSIGAGPLSLQEEAMHSAVGAIMDKMPAEAVERTGRMHALSRRAVLALIDGDAATLAAVIDRIGSWDDDPGRPPYSRSQFQFPARQALALANKYFYLAETHGAHISNQAAADGAADLIARHAPGEHRQAAQGLLSAMKADSQDGIEFHPTAADDVVGLLVFAATAAWLAMHPRVFRSLESCRLGLIQEIRESEAKALRIPNREMITDVSDDEALSFLEQLYDSPYPLPRDPDERAVVQQDIVAIVKQHLLETPADATTQEQRRALDERIKKVLSAAAGTPRRTPPPPDRNGVVRRQPKRTSKRKRQKK